MAVTEHPRLYQTEKLKLRETVLVGLREDLSINEMLGDR